MAIRSHFGSVLLATATIISFYIGAEATTTSTSTETSNTSSLGSGCYVPWIGDGFCDLIFNNAECAYDGGDCCECTCVDSDYYTCGDLIYACVDPEAHCVDDDDVTSVNASSWSKYFAATFGCIGPYMGNGYCDFINNQPDCQYDGGDCCSCTCVDTADFTCGVMGFPCVDPEAHCEDDDTSWASYSFSYDSSTSTCTESSIGDGYCDSANNQPDCEYDGGDCCSCTCVDTADFTCGVMGFACVDPEAFCVDYDTSWASYSFSYDSSTSTCTESSIGDGYCDSTNNQPDCQYDGGDCCSCTCVDALFFCGSNGYNCEDPEASCADGDVVTMGAEYNGNDDTADGNDRILASSAKQVLPTLVVCIGAMGMFIFPLE